MLKFIHLTDTHLVARGQSLYDLEPAIRLRRAIDSINREQGDAEFVVITGDLAHWGEPEAYEVLRDEVARCQLPIHLLIGNHDDRRAFLEQFKEPIAEGGFVQRQFEAGGFRHILLDSNEPGVAWGVFCETRALWLDRQIRESVLPVLIYIHHPPFSVGMAAMDRISLREPQYFEAAVRRHQNKVRHLFFGHLHRPIAGSWHGVPFSTLRATSHQVALKLGDSQRVGGSHEPAQYAVVLADTTHIVVHLHDFDDNSPRFDL